MATACTSFDGWADASLDGAGLDDALRPPASLCVDSRCPPLTAPPDAGLILWISTRAAAQAPVAVAVATALVERAPWLAPRRYDLEVALQEAIGNAVIHGHLGLDSQLRLSLAGLGEFGRRMEAGLADPATAAKPILIEARWTDHTLSLEVADQGQGFTPHSCVMPAPDAPCGRGLATIQSVCADVGFSDHGKRIRMVMARELPR